MDSLPLDSLPLDSLLLDSLLLDSLLLDTLFMDTLLMGIFNSELPKLDSPIGQSDTDTLTRPVEQEDDGGHDRYAHYIKKEKIVQSAVTGKAVRALCGKKWVPSRDPEKYPICPTCKEIYEGLKPGPNGDE